MVGAKYRTVLESLSKEILSGKYDSAQTFPSISALARRFGETRSTVYRAIAELAHQGLVRQKQGRGTVVTKEGAARKIGLIVPDIAQTEFFSLIVRGVSCRAQQKGYTLLFGEIVSDDAKTRAQTAERLAKDFVTQGVSGVIFQPIEFLRDSEAVNRRILSIFDAARIPVVLCDYDFVSPLERSNYDVVGINNVKAGYAVFQYLRTQGAKDIRFLMRPYAPQSHQDRYRGAVIASMMGWGAIKCRYMQGHRSFARRRRGGSASVKARAAGCDYLQQRQDGGNLQADA